MEPGTLRSRISTAGHTQHPAVRSPCPENSFASLIIATTVSHLLSPPRKQGVVLQLYPQEPQEYIDVAMQDRPVTPIHGDIFGSLDERYFGREAGSKPRDAN